MGAPDRARSADIVVVGAGVVGLSVAVHLRWLGARVILLERDRVGDGTSSRGFGTVAAQSRRPASYLRLLLAALDYYPEFVDRLGCSDAFRVTGSIALIRDEEELAARRTLLATQQGVDGYEAGEILDADQLRSIEPALGDAFGWGQYRAGDGQVEPAGLLSGLARAAQREGVELVQGAVVGATKRRGDTWTLDTPLAAYSAPVVVNSAGVWAGRLGRQADVTVPLRSVRGQILVLAAREPMLTATVSWSGRTDIRQASDGRIWLGTVQQPDSWDLRVRASDTELILERAAETVPQLAGAAVGEAWAALRPVPYDELPLVGPAAGAAGYYLAVGHGGLSLCGIEGRALARQIVDGQVDELMAPFDPSRAMSSDMAEQADAPTIAEQVLDRAAVYDMRTEVTDWSSVGTFAARSQKATAALARAVDEQPLRAVPPTRQ